MGPADPDLILNFYVSRWRAVPEARQPVTPASHARRLGETATL